MSTANPTPTAYCRMCGSGLTEETARDVRGVVYCEACIAARLESGAQGAPQSGQQGDQFDRAAAHVENAVRGAAKVADGATRAVVDSPPSVGLATFLGFIPGAGAMYNGQFTKAFTHIMIFFTLIGAADHISDFFAPFIAAFVVYMVIDAHKTAKARLFGTPLPDMLGLNNLFGKDIVNTPEATGKVAPPPVPSAPSEPEVLPARTPIGAMVLIGLGCMFLLRNLFDIDSYFFQKMWPMLVIGVGVFIAFRRWEIKTSVLLIDMLLPTIIIKIGVDWLLHLMRLGSFWRVYFPLYLILIGGIRLFGNTVLKESPVMDEQAPSSSSAGQV